MSLTKFDPTNTHLASVVQALDSHQVKVQAVVAAQDSLNTLFSLSKGTKVSVLEWVSPKEVALCLTNGSVQIYVPSSNSIVATLESPTNLTITDFHFSETTRTAWSADIGGNLCEWNLSTRTLVQKFALTDMLDASEQISRIVSVMYQDEPHLLIGTQNVYLVDVLGKRIVKTFPAHVQPVVSIVPVPHDPDLFLTAAEGDRFANVYSISRNAARAVLVASSNITRLELGASGDLSMAVAINETGTLELFHNPLNFDAQVQESAKKKRKHLASAVRSRHADASIKYSRPENEIRKPEDELLPISGLALSESVMHVSWTVNASLSQFDAVPWHSESGFSISGHQVLTKAKVDIKPADQMTSGHDVAAPKLYSENAMIVTEGAAFQNDLEYDEDDDEDTLAEKLEKLSGGSRKNLEAERKKLQKHTAGTLTVVLSQALRNNDHSLLETVLANKNSTVVQNTVARLDSSLAVVLLDRLGERISRHQHRFDQLNFWLKWIIIIHGGVISSIPNLSNKLANLHSILTKKASTLPRLLELQGRLDMIEQQNALKKDILRASSTHTHADDGESDVEYVEEIDDAVEQGILGSDDESIDEEMDMDMDGEDDFDEAEVDVAAIDEDGYSDVETAVSHNDVFEEE